MYCKVSPSGLARRQANMRKIISFICAVILGLGCIYGLYFIIFEARGFYIWMPVMAGVGLIVSAFLVWGGFVKRGGPRCFDSLFPSVSGGAARGRVPCGGGAGGSRRDR